MWRSAEALLYSQVPAAANRLLFHAALSARMGFTEFEEFAQEAGSKNPEAYHFYSFQNGSGLAPFWISIVEDVAEESYGTARKLEKERDADGGSVVLSYGCSI